LWENLSFAFTLTFPLAAWFECFPALGWILYPHVGRFHIKRLLDKLTPKSIHSGFAKRFAQRFGKTKPDSSTSEPYGLDLNFGTGEVFAITISLNPINGKWSIAFGFRVQAQFSTNFKFSWQSAVKAETKLLQDVLAQPDATVNHCLDRTQPCYGHCFGLGDTWAELKEMQTYKGMDIGKLWNKEWEDISVGEQKDINGWLDVSRSTRKKFSNQLDWNKRCWNFNQSERGRGTHEWLLSWAASHTSACKDVSSKALGVPEKASFFAKEFATWQEVWSKAINATFPQLRIKHKGNNFPFEDTPSQGFYGFQIHKGIGIKTPQSGKDPPSRGVVVRKDFYMTPTPGDDKALFGNIAFMFPRVPYDLGFTIHGGFAFTVYKFCVDEGGVAADGGACKAWDDVF